MGPDTAERIKTITKEQAQEAAQEAVRLVYEQMMPVLVRIAHPVVLKFSLENIGEEWVVVIVCLNNHSAGREIVAA